MPNLKLTCGPTHIPQRYILGRDRTEDPGGPRRYMHLNLKNRIRMALWGDDKAATIRARQVEWEREYK